MKYIHTIKIFLDSLSLTVTNHEFITDLVVTHEAIEILPAITN